MAIPESDYLEAFNTAGKQLQACMEQSDHPGFRWIKLSPSKPSFADLVFAIGQRMYAVLLVAMTSQKQVAQGETSATFEIPHDERELLLTESERYGLEPVVFPLWLGIMQPLTTGWNLFSLRDMSPVAPAPGSAAEAPTPMSEWELSNFCVGLVKQELAEEGLRLYSYQDIPGIFPNIWFRDADGRRAWVAALPTLGSDVGRIPKSVTELRQKLPQDVVGYVARIALTSSARPGAHPMRDELLSVTYTGLEKLP